MSVSNIQVQFATADNAARNRKTLIANTRATLGLSDDLTSWSVEQRALYSKNLATFIVEHPASFTESDYKIANVFLGQGPYYTAEQAGFVGNTDTFLNEFSNRFSIVVPTAGIVAIALVAVLIGVNILNKGKASVS